MTQADTVVPATGRRRLPVALLAALAAVAVVVALAFALLTGDEGAAPTAGTAPEGSVTAGSAPELTVSDAPPAPTGAVTVGPAPDARGAVEGFLTAEASRELEVAFTYLAEDEQAAFGSPAVYVAEHADLIGVVTGFEVLEETTDPATGTSVVVARVGFEPRLDTVTGLTPAIARVSFPVVEGEEGWSIELAGTTFVPVLPSDDRAAADGAAVVAAATACDPVPRAYPGTFLGRPAILGDLCDVDGAIEVAAVTPFDDPLFSQPFVTAYGPDLVGWARAVHVAAPVELRLVMAPYGDAWTPIGVLPPET